MAAGTRIRNQEARLRRRGLRRARDPDGLSRAPQRFSRPAPAVARQRVGSDRKAATAPSATIIGPAVAGAPHPDHARLVARVRRRVVRLPRRPGMAYAERVLPDRPAFDARAVESGFRLLGRTGLLSLLALTWLFFFLYGPVEDALPVYVAHDLQAHAKCWAPTGPRSLRGPSPPRSSRGCSATRTTGASPCHRGRPGSVFDPVRVRAGRGHVCLLRRGRGDLRPIHPSPKHSSSPPPRPPTCQACSPPGVQPSSSRPHWARRSAGRSSPVSEPGGRFRPQARRPSSSRSPRLSSGSEGIVNGRKATPASDKDLSTRARDAEARL